jgi:hypothetical protein
MVLFLWAEIGWHKFKTGASFPLSPPMVHRPIMANTGDEMGQGVAGEEVWTKGVRLRVFDGEALTVATGRQ